MKKRKNVILSAITCFVSICMLMFGVYAASSPSVSVGGQVSYTARDAKVLVQGKVNGAKGQSSTVDYPSATVEVNSVTATKVTNSSTQYLDYTAGTGNSESDVLSPWNIGTLEFAEDNTGVKDITISFKLTNLSTYPVQATLTFPSGATESDLANANVSRTAGDTSAYLDQNGGNKEITVTYKLTNDSQSISDDATNLLGMNIVFEKAAPKSASFSNSTSEINSYNGKLTMGKFQYGTVVQDVQWKCFAYYDETEQKWKAFDSTKEIPAGTKEAYFVLDTDIDARELFLSDEKYTQYTVTNETTDEDENPDDQEETYEYYINAGINGVTEEKTVYANDYYYSDVRQILKTLETTLSISNGATFSIPANNEIYKAIQGRTIEDLYKLNSVKYNDVTGEFDTINQTAPIGATMTDQDKFWLISYMEAQTLFADDDARLWTADDGRLLDWMLRSPDSDESNVLYSVEENFGSIYGGTIGEDLSSRLRPAFKLALA